MGTGTKKTRSPRGDERAGSGSGDLIVDSTTSSTHIGIAHLHAGAVLHRKHTETHVAAEDVGRCGVAMHVLERVAWDASSDRTNSRKEIAWDAPCQVGVRAGSGYVLCRIDEDYHPDSMV